MKRISIASDFSVTPGGRLNRDGPFSGEAFRSRFLEPAIDNDNPVVIELDDVAGLPSSFLEEAFGGIFRSRRNLRLESARRLLKLRANHPDVKPYIPLIERYMLEASQKATRSI